MLRSLCQLRLRLHLSRQSAAQHLTRLLQHHLSILGLQELLSLQTQRLQCFVQEPHPLLLRKHLLRELEQRIDCLVVAQVDLRRLQDLARLFQQFAGSRWHEASDLFRWFLQEGRKAIQQGFQAASCEDETLTRVAGFGPRFVDRIDVLESRG